MSILTMICEASEYESCEDAIREMCVSPRDVGELVAELVAHNADRANRGDRFAMANSEKLLSAMANMLRDYLDDTV